MNLSFIRNTKGTNAEIIMRTCLVLGTELPFELIVDTFIKEAKGIVPEEELGNPCKEEVYALSEKAIVSLAMAMDTAEMFK